MSDLKDLYTPKQTAAQLYISVSRLRELATQGKIEYQLTPGGHRRYTKEAISSARENGWNQTIVQKETSLECNPKFLTWRKACILLLSIWLWCVMSLALADLLGSILLAMVLTVNMPILGLYISFHSKEGQGIERHWMRQYLESSQGRFR
jgi:hypothetical protein